MKRTGWLFSPLPPRELTVFLIWWWPVPKENEKNRLGSTSHQRKDPSIIQFLQRCLEKHSEDLNQIGF
ncbi:hypothetical protein NDU88_002724 [Pleurodeles waltl]|uniref:Uncharacterized protein n=1 Tax=Pleurodeles waltl TaxID=8319 RepID=A0AAV7SBT9_PLEWA|nr:hypothetical protein NDU88_002724 [Pleurodeles waltl]